MFEQLSDRLRSTMKRVRGQARLTEENISEALREVRIALLEADVALAVAKDFIKQVRQRAIGEDVAASLSPGQQLIKIVNQELVTVMGEANDALDLSQRPPAVRRVLGRPVLLLDVVNRIDLLECLLEELTCLGRRPP